MNRYQDYKSLSSQYVWFEDGQCALCALQTGRGTYSPEALEVVEADIVFADLLEDTEVILSLVQSIRGDITVAAESTLELVGHKSRQR
jgi:hypothetical protein